MTEFYKDNYATIYKGSAQNMSEVPDEFVQSVVTSPPYWGLRTYDGEQDLIWPNRNVMLLTGRCRHEWGDAIEGDTRGYGAGMGKWIEAESGRPHIKISQGKFCNKCGAWHGGFGLEPTPELYIEHSMQILNEIRRVLRPDGIVFWNLGDSYYSNPGNGLGGKPSITGAEPHHTGMNKLGPSVKPKDLCLIPERFAIAAQADGWWIRSRIIWYKRNPMPESVRDRPTNTHEIIYMLTKSKRYYWDEYAVREPAQDWGSRDRTYWSHRVNAEEFGQSPHRGGERGDFSVTGRNIRDVWEMNTKPCPDAHFAVFPDSLPERCIKASTSEKGVCSKCGKPWSRVTENKPMEIRRSDRAEEIDRRYVSSGMMVSPAETKTIGWEPGCKSNAEVVPCTVLNPFGGSGTTAAAAKKLQRKGIMYDLSAAYCDLAVNSVRQHVLDLEI